MYNVQVNLRRKTIQSKGYAKKRQQQRLFLASLAAICFAIFFLGSYFVTRASFLQITSVTVTGTETVSSSTIQKIVTDDLQGNWLYLYPKSNTFLYPAQRISHDIVTAFPRIDKVSFSKSGSGVFGFDQLTVSLVERDPFALLCSGNMGGTIVPESTSSVQSMQSAQSMQTHSSELTKPSEIADAADAEADVVDTTAAAANPCFFIDSTGYIYATAPAFSSGVYIRFHQLADKNLALGTYIDERTYFEKINTIEQYLSRMSLTVTDIVLPDKSGKLAVTFTAPASSAVVATSSTDVYFNVNDTTLPLTTTLGYFNDFWQESVRNASTKKMPLNFDYIDMRYGRDIVYKLVQ